MYNGIEDNLALSEPLGLFPKEVAIKPFLKWAGGKSQLLPELSKYIPANFNKYIEPFVGGGALFFYLNKGNSIISDANEELIITYLVIRDFVEDVITILEGYRNEETFYYFLRSLNPNNLSEPERAARFIFLNKTCFNGLHRVNKKGAFNVPYGKGNGEFLNKEQLRNSSEFLQETEIIHSDYITTLNNFAHAGDFIFLDPPYYPVGRYSDFKRYTKDYFYHDDHIALKKQFDRLVNMGCYVILTNSDHPFILDLFRGYEIKIIETKRLISSNPNTRSGRDIIVIGNS